MTTPFLSGNLGLGTLSGSTLTEPTAAEYQRQPVTFTGFPGGSGSNDGAANFGQVISAAWCGGTLTSWGLFDSVGNQVMSGALASSIPANVTNPLTNITVMEGAISISFSGAAPPSSSSNLTDYNGQPLTDYLGNPVTTS